MQAVLIGDREGHYQSIPTLSKFKRLVWLKVDDCFKEKSSLTGPEIFVVVFSYEKEEDSVKK